MSLRKNASFEFDEPPIDNSRRLLKRQNTTREESPEFGQHLRGNLSKTQMLFSKSGTMSVFDSNKNKFTSESIAMSGTKIKNFSIMNVSFC